MSDVISLSELATIADNERAPMPELPEHHRCREIREAASVPTTWLAAVVGVSSPTICRFETAGKNPSDVASVRRLRRVLGALEARVLERDPLALAV